MNKEHRFTISLDPVQYKFIVTLAKAKHKHRLSAAIREVIDEVIKKPLN